MHSSILNRIRSSTPSSNRVNPIELICMSLVPRSRANRSSSTTNIIIDFDDFSEPPTPVPSNEYGYLKHIQSYKSLCRVDDKSLSRKVRKFYAKQLELITSIENVLIPKTEEERYQLSRTQYKEQRAVRILIIINLIVNIILVIIKIIGAVVSQSLSVISSVVNSITDIRTNLVLIWAARSIQKRDPYKYPAGRTRLQTVSVIMLSIVMCAASVQIIIESGERLSKDINYFQNNQNISTTDTLPDIDMTPFSITAMVLSICAKAILFITSYRSVHPSISVLSADNRNDVLSGIVALSCGLIASNARDGNIKTEAVVIDPIGAIVISACVLFAWGMHAYKYVRFLTGLAADPMIVQRIAHIAYNYRPDVVTSINSVQALHFGVNYFADIDIGLSKSMPLAIAHDIGIELQDQLETMDDIERAFVYLDFEVQHKRISVSERF
ncbi:hypothetical protein I4U23_023967 [Adineta vaga]|nr:hypothetical protein I4U23_023967 [Adineta vaga]